MVLLTPLSSTLSPGLIALVDTVVLTLLCGGSVCFRLCDSITNTSPNTSSQTVTSPTTLAVGGFLIMALIITIVAATHLDAVKSRLRGTVISTEHSHLQLLASKLEYQLEHASRDAIFLSEQLSREFSDAVSLNQDDQIEGYLGRYLTLDLRLQAIEYLDSQGKPLLSLNRNAASELNKEVFSNSSQSSAVLSALIQSDALVHMQILPSDRAAKTTALPSLADQRLWIITPIINRHGSHIGALSLIYRLPDLALPHSYTPDPDPSGTIVLAKAADIFSAMGADNDPKTEQNIRASDMSILDIGYTDFDEKTVVFERIKPDRSLMGWSVYPDLWLVSLFPHKTLSELTSEETKPYVIMYGLSGVLLALLVALGLRLLAMKHLADGYLEQKAYFDNLTGLPNRHLFLQRLAEEAERGVRDGQHPALIYLDLDKFKLVNDVFGHDAGDTVLTTVGQRLKACVRPYDIVSRMGGDEFTVILVAPITDQALVTVANRIIEAIGTPIDYKGQSATVGASLGVTRFGDREESVDAVINRADALMYQAKEGGRNRVEIG